MLEERAIVIAEEGGGLWVEATSRSSCTSCSSGSCTTAVVSKLFGVKHNRFLLENEIAAEPGDEVMIGIPDESLVKASLWAYLLPMVVMLSMAGLGALMNVGDGLQVLLASAGLVGGLLVVRRVSASGALNRFKPRLLRLVERNESFSVSVPMHPSTEK
ncbi:MAG: SoxR reducing system RseC family protein [Sedimenticola sp.]